MGCYCYNFFRLSSDFKSDSIRNSVVSFFFLFGRSGRHSFTDGPSRIGAGERVTKPRFHMRRPIKHRPSIKKKKHRKRLHPKSLLFAGSTGRYSPVLRPFLFSISDEAHSFPIPIAAESFVVFFQYDPFVEEEKMECQ